ncbi:MAG: DUF1641 domain-containing protein [Conexivisphaerales archaeon]
MSSEHKIEDMISKLPPEKVASLEKILARADLLNRLLDRAESLEESGAIDSATSTVYLVKTFLDALHEDTMSNLAATAGSLLELGKAVSREDVKENILKTVNQLNTVTYTLEKLDELRKSGALDALIETAYLVKTIRDMVTDDSVSNLAGKIASVMELLPILPDLAATINNEAVVTMLQATASQEVEEALKNPPKVGYRALISSLRDEDMQRGLGFLLVLGKAVGKKVKKVQ